MELSEPIPVLNLNHEEPNLELGLRSSSPKSDLDPPLSDLDYTAGIEEELRNLDLREAEERDSIKEEEEEEESECDDNTRSKSEVLNENESETENENENGNQIRKKYPYPVRPEAEDCAYYMKTGTCKFGSNCKFNHPVRRKNKAAKEKVKEREELVERPGQGQSQSQSLFQSQNQSQIECKYYLRTGGCKFGKACRYNHTRAKSTVAPVLELNFLGLPIRPGEKECPYYMRNGSCKFASNCIFNHPDPTAVGGPESPSGYGNGGSVSPQAASQVSLGSWSSPRALNEPTHFVPIMYSPTQGVPSQNSEWNGYQAPLYPPERSVHSAPPYVMNSPMIDTNIYTNHQPQILVDEFPERPGQPECSYFLKTGDCKYKSNCKYHHPKNRGAKSPPCMLSDKGLPLRPGQNICSHYSRYGICKFGPACKFDHPIHPDTSSAENGLDPPPSLDDSATRQETGMAGTGNGNGSDNKIQQSV